MRSLILLPVILGVVCGSPLGKLSFEPTAVEQLSLGMNGGKKVPITKHPYTVYVLNEKGNIWGAGAILNENWVVTTGYNAWALDPTLIRAGSNTWNKGGQLVKVANKTIHEEFNVWAGWAYDIAVYKLETPLKFNKKVKAIELSTKKVKAGTTGVVLGLNGNPEKEGDHLVELSVTRDTDKSCKTVYSTYYGETVYCTKSEEDGPCAEDFGDPLVIDGKLAGLYAGVIDDCSQQAASRLYTNVPMFVDWVLNATKS